MPSGVVIKKTVTFATKARGKHTIGCNSQSAITCARGRVPRVARLMALAIKLNDILAAGRELTQADLAELGHVTKARMTQILNLTLLSPDIQAELLDLPLVTSGHDPISESDLRPLCAEPSWATQGRMWDDLVSRSAPATKLSTSAHHDHAATCNAPLGSLRL